jgi:RNA ligase
MEQQRAANDNDFMPFQKIPRLRRGCIITEKIDGTNAQVFVGEDGSVRAGSRNRWITPEADNFGFAGWVAKHADILRELGPGRHYGEWYGLGVQRGYGMTERRFALFNTGRWSTERPACCDVVPVLYAGQFTTEVVDTVVEDLRREGSRAEPGFMKPEGVIVFLTAARTIYKVLLENDDISKSEAEAA